MRRSIIAALLCTTFLTPAPARAEPVSFFLSQFVAGITGAGASVIGGSVAGGALGTSGFLLGSSFGKIVGGALGRLVLSAGLSALARKLGPRPPQPQASARMVNYSQAITPMEWVFGQVRKGGPYAVRSFQTPTRYYGVILAAHEITAIDQWYLDNRPVEINCVNTQDFDLDVSTSSASFNSWSVSTSNLPTGFGNDSLIRFTQTPPDPFLINQDYFIVNYTGASDPATFSLAASIGGDPIDRLESVSFTFSAETTQQIPEVCFVSTSPYPPYMRVRGYLGAPEQAADPAFVAAIPEWTSAHNMAGLAYVAAEIDRPPDSLFSDILGNSPPTGPAVTPVIRGVKVYDPRTEATVYSNNAALVWAWIIENRLGEGSVDWDAVAIEADAADVFVTNRTGGLQRKWALNGVFSDDTDFASLLDQIIVSCDGKSYETPEGKIGFYVGRYIEPTITLTDDDLRSATLAVRDFGQDPFTEFVAEYVEPANDWVESPSATLVVDAVSRVNRSTVQMGFVNNHNQAFRALKRIARSTRAQYVMRCEIGIIGLELMQQRFVRINAVGVDFVAEIADWQPGADDASFVLELVSVTAADFDFNAATEEPAPPPRDRVTNDNTVPDPSGLVGTAIAGPGIEWTWNAQPAELQQEFRFREVGATEWQPVITIRDGATDLITPGLVDGASYEAELRNITAARRPSDWITSAAVQAVANSTPPEPVTDLFATVDVDDIDLGWITANDPLHVATRLYRAVDSTDFGDAVLLDPPIFGGPNIAQIYTDPSLAPETYVYWAASVNASGVQGTLAGPVSATVT